MSSAILIVLLASIAGIAFASSQRASKAINRANAAWFGCGILALLFAGLWVAGDAGKESAAYGFGIAICLWVLIMLVAGLVFATGKTQRKRKENVE